MIGSSMMMASFGFMIYTISPAYSNSDMDKKDIKSTGIPNDPIGTNVWDDEESVYFVDGGYGYTCKKGSISYFFGEPYISSYETLKWEGSEFIFRGAIAGRTDVRIIGRKIKLP